MLLLAVEEPLICEGMDDLTDNPRTSLAAARARDKSLTVAWTCRRHHWVTIWVRLSQQDPRNKGRIPSSQPLVGLCESREGECHEGAEGH